LEAEDFDDGGQSEGDAYAIIMKPIIALAVGGIFSVCRSSTSERLVPATTMASMNPIANE
jgi:hypothetical protein